MFSGPVGSGHLVHDLRDGEEADQRRDEVDAAHHGRPAEVETRHPVFGRGEVLAVLGSDLNQKLRIKFERAGVKTVMVRYANLELA